MLRREFVLGAAVAAPPRAGIIDTHTHFYDPSRPGGVPWPPKTDELLYRTVLPRDFRSTASGLGVTATVVVEASPLLEDNQWILDLAKDEPVIAGFIGRLDPTSPDFASRLARFSRNRLFRGIRLNGRAIAEGLPHPRFVANLRRMADEGLTVDAIGDAEMFPNLLRLAQAAPKLKIVIDHLPFDSQPGLPKLPNIWAKVSNVRPDTPTGALDELWTAYGADRVVFGSNWPVSERIAPYPQILRRVQAYFNSKGSEAATKYFHYNARAAYGLSSIPR